jgi:hypothetical protein
MAVSAAVALVASIAVAEEPARIQVDLPSVSTSAGTVPPGALQFEGGVEYTRARANRGSDKEQLAAAAATSLTGHQPDYGFRAGVGVRFGR